MSYGISTTVGLGFDEAVAAVRSALADEGFGVVTEIDMAATLKGKLGVDVPAQTILGVCNPALAHRALGTEESIGLLLPCTVVVRIAGDGRTVVEALDPQVMVTVTGNEALTPVADEAADRLRTAVDSLARG